MMNIFFERFVRLKMDSRLRGNDTEIGCNIVVIPAKAGIHTDTSKKV